MSCSLKITTPPLRNQKSAQRGSFWAFQILGKQAFRHGHPVSGRWKNFGLKNFGLIFRSLVPGPIFIAFSYLRGPAWLDDRGTIRWKWMEDSVYHVVPHAHCSRPLSLIGLEAKGLLGFQGRCGIGSVVPWNLRRVIPLGPNLLHHITLSFGINPGKTRKNPQKQQGFVLAAEPLKSLENKQKTLKKARIWKGKSKEIQNGKEKKIREFPR